MISPKSVESALHITPTISTQMKNAIELWESMYRNESPWLASENLASLNLASMIASEKARTATIEMEIKITGESERAKYIKEQFEKIKKSIRKNLEYGIALGGFVIKPYVVVGADNKYKIEFNYCKATDFYPLSYSPEGDVTEAAFLDRVITKDIVYSKLEYHKLVGTKLVIKNMAFKSMKQDVQINIGEGELGTPVSLSSVSAWSALEPEIIINDVDKLMFAYFKMPEANQIDLDSPLGASGFSRAIKLIHDADKQYSDLLWEFEGGQLAIDVDRTALNPILDSNGNVREVLPQLQDRLFRRNFDFKEDAYNVFSPALRDKSIVNGLNTILMHIEDVCAISRGTLSEVTVSEARTATELKILKQRSFAANADIQKELEGVLQTVIEIMDKYCDLYKIVPSGEFEVAYKWDDSIIVDKDAERQIDLLDVDKGLMSKIEYRMKWMGETKEQAEQAIKEIDDAKFKEMQAQQNIMLNSQIALQNNKNNNGETTEIAAEHAKLTRSNESIETTKKNESP